MRWAGCAVGWRTWSPSGGGPGSAWPTTWAVTYLADRPDLQAQLATGETDLVERVVDETLRLRPPVWGSVRMAAKPDTLSGYRVRRFTTVLVPIFALHHHPGYWPEPTRFDPDRFLPDQLKTRPASAYLPFLVGPRHCIGMRLAMLELRLILKVLCRRFEFTVTGPVETDPSFALRVRGAPRRPRPSASRLSRSRPASTSASATAR